MNEFDTPSFKNGEMNPTTPAKKPTAEEQFFRESDPFGDAKALEEKKASEKRVQIYAKQNMNSLLVDLDYVQGRSPKAAAEIEKAIDIVKKREIDELGSMLHDEWRASRKREDGTFEPRIKVLAKTETGEEKWFDADKVPAGAEEIMRQDIANTDFVDLEAKWKQENASAAEVAMNNIYNLVTTWRSPREWHDIKSQGRDIVQEDLLNASINIHNKWLERNSWVYDPKYGNPSLAKEFFALSKEEQEKDRAQAVKAAEIFRKAA